MANTINVDDVLTHAQLDDYLGGQLTAQQYLVPRGDPDTAKTRTWALDEVLAALASRTPPIYESDLSRPAELVRAVRHRAAERLYDLAMTSGTESELYYAKMKLERDRASAAIDSLNPTVGGGDVQATTRSIGIARR